MLSLLKSTHAFKQKFSFELEQTDLSFKLTHITLNYGACSLHLGLMFFVQPLFHSFLQVFKIKLRDSIV